jgi:hypothetical protein
MSARKPFYAVRLMDMVANVRAITVRNTVQDCRSITQFSIKPVQTKYSITKQQVGDSIITTLQAKN